MEKTVENWLNQGFAKSTYRVYRLGLKLFLDFLNETEGSGWTPKKIVAARLEDLQSRKFAFEQKIVDFYQWLKDYETKPTVTPYRRRNARSGKIFEAKFRKKGGKKFSDNTRKGFIHGIRSFFTYHRLDLRLTNQQKRLIGKKPRPVKKDYLFELEDIQKMAKVANPQERFILLAGKDCGLRATDFLSLTQGTFARALELSEKQNPPITLGEIYTQKEGVMAYPFLTQDGLEASKVWLLILKSRGLRDDKAPMLTIKSKELSQNLRRLTRKTGLDPHGKRVRFHCLRKFLIDRLSLRMSESKWRQIVGKQIDEGAYVSRLDLEESYKSVMDRIEIPKSTPLNHERLSKIEIDLQQSRERTEKLERIIADLERDKEERDKHLLITQEEWNRLKEEQQEMMRKLKMAMDRVTAREKDACKKPE